MTKRSNTRPPRRPFTPRVTPLNERVDSTAAFWEFPTEVEERPALPEPLAPCARSTPPPAPVSHAHGPLGFRRRPLIWLGIALTVGASVIGLAVRASLRADALAAQEAYLTPSGDLRSRPLRVFARQLTTAKPRVVPVAMDIPPEAPGDMAPELPREMQRASRDIPREAPRETPRETPRKMPRQASRDMPRESSPAAERQRSHARAEAREPERVQAKVAKPEPAATEAVATSMGFYGVLAVDSEPSGARVFINGQPVGATPLVIDQVPAGSRVVRVEGDAYQPWSSAIRIVANEETRIVATLKR